MEGIVEAVCISKERGTQKKDIGSAEFISDYGIRDDAHAGKWHRQVSLLSYDKVEEFRARGGDVENGAFGENLLVRGIDFRSLPVGSVFVCGDVQLKMTQIGKDCHSHCNIYKRVGDCIMPREGVFAEVIHGGTISTGDTMTVQLPSSSAKLTAAVITLSDKGSSGERKDTSGPCIVARLADAGYDIVEQIILPDERRMIEKELKRIADQRQVNLIITTGGTGFSMRDCTPEATMAVADRIAPGISEAIRFESMKITKRAMLGRGVSVIRKKTLIVNLPGSTKAVNESLDIILDTFEHGIRIMVGLDGECGNGGKA